MKNSISSTAIYAFGIAFSLAAMLSTRADDGAYWITVEANHDSAHSLMHAPTLSDFESLAAQTEYLDKQTLLYDRSFNLHIQDSFTAVAKQLPVLAHSAQLEVLEATVTHENPRVRTLGLYALFAKEDPKLLPLIYAAIHDSAKTFPEKEGERSLPYFPTAQYDYGLPIAPDMAALKEQNKYRVPVRDSTVGEHAAAMLEFYLQSGDYAFDREGNLNPRFLDKWEAYWEPRQERDHCASWIRVAYRRAKTGMSRLRGERIQIIEGIRYQKIRELPSPDRQLTLLMLATEWRKHPDERVLQEQLALRILASEYDLREACQQLGPERLMQVLRYEPITDDPDLQPDAREYRQIVRWILMTAEDVLPPEVAPELVELGLNQQARGEIGFNSPWWFIAAAQLQPENAREYLDLAWPLFANKYKADERAWLMWARWKVYGLEEYDTIAEWYYGDKDQPDVIGGGYHRFVNILRGPDASTLLAKLALEDGFLELNAQDLGYFSKGVSRFAFNPPVDPQEYTNLGRPGHPSVEEAQNAIRAWTVEELQSKEAR